MAYENYNFVSWSDGTPISSLRLAQMSTNIEQVKDVVDDKASGVIKFNQVNTNTTLTYTNFGVENILVSLKDDTATGGQDRRVNIDENRYYKITVNIPSINVADVGNEDSKFIISLFNSATITANSNVGKIASWEVTPHTFSYINVAAATGNNATNLRANMANISNEAIKTAAYPSKIGAGTYSLVRTTGSALTNQSFILTVQRAQGLSNVNLPSWGLIVTTTAPVQIYVEDAGGI